jgi:SAM-dependent methyltransferase
MTESEAARASWSSSADAWISNVSRDLSRELILDRPMREHVGDVRGRQVLDVGCGEGRFCRVLKELGAEVVGIDPTPEFLAKGRQADPDGQFALAVGEALPFADKAFDVVVSYLVLIDIPDFRRSILEAARVLKPGGRFVVANLNSFITTRPNAYYRDAEGRKLHVAVEEYYTERPQIVSWAGIEVVNYHRPFEAYVQAFLAAGLTLESFYEPRPSPEAAREHPEFVADDLVPFFHTMVWRK